MRDKVEGKPLVVDQIAAKMMAQGVSIQAWVSHFVIAPPLIVTKEELDLGIAALDRASGDCGCAGGGIRQTPRAIASLAALNWALIRTGINCGLASLHQRQ